MAYHDRDDDVKKNSAARLILRIFLILILVAGVACVAMYRSAIFEKINTVLNFSKDEDPIPLLSLERGPLQLEVEADGEIVGLGSVAVNTPRTGVSQLKLAWLADEGSLVNQGDTLVRFDSTDTQLNLESQNNTLTTNTLNTQVQTGQQQLSEKSMEIDRTTAKMDYDYSMAVLPDDPTIFSQWEIITGKLNADFAKSKIDNLAVKAKATKRNNRSQAQQSLIDRNKSLTDVSISQQALSVMEIKAPVAGLVTWNRLQRRDPKVGDSYQANQKVVDLVDLNSLQARIYVLEKEAGSLAKGKPVIIRLDALPDKEFHGEVTSVTTVAALIDYNSPLQYFTCEVTIRDAGPSLRLIKPGMKLSAEVILEKYDSCFVVPSSAVDFKNDIATVYIKKGKDFEKRQVKVGMGKHGQATILSGVNEKEIIALRNPFEERQLKLPDFSKASATNQMQRGGGPGGMGGGGGRGGR
jgi:multidrug efflux pump subunit AcrA (membrane-fusion protein)